MPLSEHSSQYSPVGSSHTWRPGVFKRFPTLGVLQLVGAILGICAAIAILIFSDGALISDWKYSPAVYLTISYTISNTLLGAAFSQGVILTWWNKAIKDGTVLGDLHRYHAQGTGAWAALTSGKHFSFIAFATLFVTLTPINGPLLQRSSTIGTKSLSSQADLRVPITRALWDGTGFVYGRTFDVSLFSQPSNDIMQAYYRGDPIIANNTGCPGDAMCTGLLAGAGLAVNCSTTSADYDLSPSTGVDAEGNTEINRDAFSGFNVFMSNFFWGAMYPGNISMGVQYRDDPAITGKVVVQNCSLQAAIVQYPVVIDGNSSTISLAAKTSIFDDIFLSINPYPSEVGGQGQASEIGGYAFALSTRFDAWTLLRWGGGIGYEIRSQGSVGPQFALMDNDGTSAVTFSDPTPYLLSQARELMFRTALAQGNASSIEVP